MVTICSLLLERAHIGHQKAMPGTVDSSDKSRTTREVERYIHVACLQADIIPNPEVSKPLFGSWPHWERCVL
jgi:hypothetical protein